MDTPTAGPANRDSPPPEIVANDRGPARNARRVRVRMYHTDLVGAVYHGTYFDLFEEARTEVFRALGYTYHDCVDGEGRLMIIVHADCDYLSPARMDDELLIAVRVEAVSRARLTFVYDVSLGAGGKQVARGRQVFAFLDTQTQRPASVPPRLAALIRAVPDFGLISGNSSAG